MMKNIAASLALLLTVACSSLPSHQSQASSSGSGASSFGAAEGSSYVLLSSPNQIREMDYASTVNGLYVRGTLTSRGFAPATAKVEGSGSLCNGGTDWLSFSDLSVHKSSDGKTPTAPYVLGCAKGSSFVPATRDIVTQ